jgi:hypothetical protein
VEALEGQKDDMPRTLNVPKSRKRPIRQLVAEVDGLRARVEDLEDVGDLREAVRRNGNKPLIPWTRAKKELGLL